MTEPSPAAPGLDLSFIHRVYRTSLALVLIGALLLWARLGARAALGLLIGTLLSLMILAALEWSIRRFIRPQADSLQPLVLVTIGKLLLAAAILFFLFLAAARGWISIVWVLPGFALPHLVIGLKLVGRKLNELTGASREPRT